LAFSFFINAVPGNHDPGQWVMLACFAAFASNCVVMYASYRNAELPRQRRRAGRCIQCGYLLRGNASGTCPECGKRFPKRPKLSPEDRIE
jgi:hypothetical protein